MCLRRKDSSKGKCMPSTKRGHTFGHAVEIQDLYTLFHQELWKPSQVTREWTWQLRRTLQLTRFDLKKKKNKQEESKKRTELLWNKLSLKSKLGDLRNICEKNRKNLPVQPLAALALPITEEGVDNAFKQTHHRSISTPQPPMLSWSSTASRFAPQLHYSLGSLLWIFCIYNGIFHLRL